MDGQATLPRDRPWGVYAGSQETASRYPMNHPYGCLVSQDGSPELSVVLHVKCKPTRRMWYKNEDSNKRAFVRPVDLRIHKIYFRSYRTDQIHELQMTLPVQDVWLPVSPSGAAPQAPPPATVETTKFQADCLGELPQVTQAACSSASGAPAARFVSAADLNLLSLKGVLFHHSISEGYTYSVLAKFFHDRKESIAPPHLNTEHPLLHPAPGYVCWPKDTRPAQSQGQGGAPPFRFVFCQRNCRTFNGHAQLFPGTVSRSEARFWAHRADEGRIQTDLVLPDALSKTVFREVDGKVRRFVRIVLIELASEVGLGLHELGFSSLVALEMTSEAAMFLWSREASSSIPRRLFDASVQAATHVRTFAWLQQAVMNEGDEGDLDPQTFDHFNQRVDVSGIRHEREPVSEGPSRLGRKRENRRKGGDVSINTRYNAERRLVKEKGDFLTLLHLIHIVARQDVFQLEDADRNQPFAFWNSPRVPEVARYNRKDLGEFLEDNLDTTTLVSVEFHWGVEYLLAHYKSIFPWIEGGLDMIEEERQRRGQAYADQGVQASAAEAMRVLADQEKVRDWNKRLLERAIREASQDSHEEAVRAAYPPPPMTPAKAESPSADPPPPASPPPPPQPPPTVLTSASSRGQAAAAPGRVQGQQTGGGAADSPPATSMVQPPQVAPAAPPPQAAVPPPQVAPALHLAKAPPEQVLPHTNIPPRPPPGSPVGLGPVPPPPPPPPNDDDPMTGGPGPPPLPPPPLPPTPPPQVPGSPGGMPPPPQPPPQVGTAAAPLPPPSAPGDESPPRSLIIQRINRVINTVRRQSGHEFPRQTLGLTGVEMPDQTTLDCVLDTLRGIDQYRTHRSVVEDIATEFGVTVFQCLCQIQLLSGPTVTGTGTNIWLRNLADYTTVSAFISGGASSLMADIAMVQVVDVVQDPLPDLAIFAPAISDALIANSQAFEMDTVKEVTHCYVAWTIFNRLRYEIVCLQEVPHQDSTMNYATSMGDIGLAGPGLDALKDHLVQILHQAEAAGGTPEQYWYSKARQCFDWMGNSTSKNKALWKHMGWVVLTLVQTGHVHVVLAMALRTLRAQSRVETSRHVNSPSQLRDIWRRIWNGLPQKFNEVSERLRDAFAQMNWFYMAQHENDDDDDNGGPDQGGHGGRGPPPPPLDSRFHQGGSPSGSHGQAAAAPGSSSGPPGGGGSGGGQPPAPPGAPMSVSLTDAGTSKRKKKRAWESDPQFTGREAPLITARSMKDSGIPANLWILSEFLKAPSERTTALIVPFKDSSNPLATVDITFNRNCERTEDMWYPDLTRVYVDTQHHLVIRPDETLFQDETVQKDAHRSWRHINVPISWGQMMYSHMLFTTVMSATLFRDSELQIAPNRYEVSKTEKDKGQPKVKSKHCKNQGLASGFPINLPRNALTLVRAHPRALRIWAGDMCKNASEQTSLQGAINVVVHYVESDIDRHLHFRFDSAYRMDRDAENRVYELRIQSAKDPAAREKSQAEQIEKLRRVLFGFVTKLRLPDTPPQETFPILKPQSGSKAVFFFREEVGPVTFPGADFDPSTPKKCYWAPFFHKEGKGDSSGQAAASPTVSLPPLEEATRENYTMESTGTETVSLPVTFYFVQHTGGKVVDDTWLTRGNGKCFLRVLEVISEAEKGVSPGHLNHDILERVCREHNEKWSVPAFDRHGTRGSGSMIDRVSPRPRLFQTTIWMLQRP